MKKLFVSCFASFLLISTQAQSVKGRLKSLTKNDSSGILKSVSKQLSTGSRSLSEEEIIKGLKEALTIGADSCTRRLGRADGFFANAAIRIQMPPEAQKVESTLRKFGMASLVDKSILTMNRAAEDASNGVSQIFWDAIRQMSLRDGLSILNGGDFAATDYLKQQTTATLTAKITPVIKASLDKVNATESWKEVFSTYNKFSRQQVNTDLVAYVTGKALDGLFHELSLEEQKIRKDPAARVTDILKKVFTK